MRQPDCPETGHLTRRATLAGLAAGALFPRTAGATTGPTGLTEPGGLPVWRLPAGSGRTCLAVVARPASAGPFPLALLAHGSTENAADRRRFPLPVYPVLTGWLNARGFAVVLPQRPGHGETGGPYVETQGPCEAPDYARAGRRTAATMVAALAFLRRQTDLPVDPARVVVFGVSAGGWGGLALAADPPPGLVGVVAFAPGRGGRSYGIAGRTCAPNRLVAAAGVLGQAARVPVLSIYAQNDTFFPPALAARIGTAHAVLASSRWVMVPAFGGEGHRIAEDPAAVPLWEPEVVSSLRHWGLPA
jgi:dienelactone hydrolase